ncbi:MAG: 3-dehydroquinate synthase [Gemmatimonadaceae bacterium]
MSTTPPARTMLGAPVIIGESLGSAGPRIASTAPSHVYAVVTDATVHALPVFSQLVEGLRAAGHGRVIHAEVPPGEDAKTRERWAALSDWLLAEGCGRDTTLVALGGGVIGDLSGFVAATYMRGIAFVQCPTTLLAMVDAALGGKTGVDTPAGKNLIGAFHRPSLVVIDPRVLSTLPPAQVRAGMAEVLKHGAIADAAYFHRAAGIGQGLAEGTLHRESWWATGDAVDLVTRSVEIKTSVVERDEREAGLREVLNFGHTIAHALETVMDFQLLHGDAVAIGMVAEARAGESLNLTEAGTAAVIAGALRGCGLPTRLPPGVDAAALISAARADKKGRRGEVRIAVPEAIGRMVARDGWRVVRPGRDRPAAPGAHRGCDGRCSTDSLGHAADVFSVPSPWQSLRCSPPLAAVWMSHPGSSRLRSRSAPCCCCGGVVGADPAGYVRGASVPERDPVGRTDHTD